MSIQPFKTALLLFCIAFISSCSNELNEIISEEECLPQLSNLRLTQTNLNDCALTSGPAGSTYSFIADVGTSCLRTTDSLQILVDFFEPTGIVNQQNFYQPIVFVNPKLVQGALCLRFGTADFAKVKGVVFRGEAVSDTVTRLLTKPPGAN